MKKLLYKLTVLFVFSILACVLILPFTVHAQPFKSASEILFNFTNVQECFNGDCSKARVTAAVAKTAFSSIHLSGVFKLSEDSGKLGAQALLYINDHIWIAGESVTNFSWEHEHEVLVGADIAIDLISLMPYIGFYTDDNSLAAFGLKVYYSDSVSIGVEYHLDPANPENNYVTAMIGASIIKGLFKPLQDLFGGINE